MIQYTLSLEVSILPKDQGMVDESYLSSIAQQLYAFDAVAPDVIVHKVSYAESHTVALERDSEEVALSKRLAFRLERK